MNRVDVEKGIVGACIQDVAAIDEYLSMGGSERFFSDKTCKTIFKAIIDIYNRGDDVDLITVSCELSASKVTSVDVAKMSDNGIISSVSTYTKLLMQMAQKDAISKALIEAGKAMDYSTSHTESIDAVERIIFEATQTVQTETLVLARVGMREAIDELEALSRGEEEKVSTGLRDIDSMSGGDRPGDMVVLAARPSMGKTALALRIAEHVALREGKKVLFFSLEMTRVQLLHRLIMSISGVSKDKISKNHMSENDWSRVADAAKSISKSEIYIDEKTRTSLEMRSRCRRAKRKGDLGLVVVDYIQLMQCARKVESSEQEVSLVSRDLKSLAKELDCPVLALSQLSRKNEQRDNKRPILSDLRGSGSIEQDADKIAFLYRDSYYKRSDGRRDDGETEYILAKNRNGATGTVKVFFNSDIVRFEGQAAKWANSYPSTNKK